VYGERGFTGGELLGVERIGRYEVLSHLASGGMGQVYLARTTGLGGFERHVVVKTLEVEDDNDQFVTMFLDEARLVGALHHQYIAPVYEVGCDEEGRYFLVMDYIHGETAEVVWKRSIEHNIQIPLPFALTAVAAIASALDYAHSLCAPDGTPLEIVHRDISLSNIMIGYEGGVKLIDFGIAKSANRTTRTQVGTLKGKFGYLSPEQVLRKPVDHRTDIFALGIVLYEMTTMARAFVRDSDLLTLEAITRGDLKPPSQVRAGYPRALEMIVMKALAIDPDLRYPDAGEMARDIEMLARTLDIVLGDSCIVDTMKHLCSRPLPGNRKRLAKSSSQVRLQREAERGIVHPQDEDDTPVLAMQPVEPIDDGDHTIPVAVPRDLVSPAVSSFAPLLRAQTATAELRRRHEEKVRRLWLWFGVGSVVIAVLVALVIGRL
jgi:serine/threonine-protein kinase